MAQSECELIISSRILAFTDARSGIGGNGEVQASYHPLFEALQGVGITKQCLLDASGRHGFTNGGTPVINRFRVSRR